MSEMQTVEIRIGPYGCTTSVDVAKQVVSDPAKLLRLYDLMEEAAQTLRDKDDTDDGTP